MRKSLSETSEDDSIKSETGHRNINYREWIKNRKELRQGLNKLDLDAEYLKRKKDLTEIEKRVLYKIMFVDKEIQTDVVVRIFNITHIFRPNIK